MVTLATNDWVFPERALSVRQPYAEAIVRGWKDVENRTWALADSRLPIWVAIHASAKRERLPLWLRQRLSAEQAKQIREAPLGAIVGVVEIRSIEVVTPSPWWDGSSLAWALNRAIRFEDPIPCKGGLSIWKLPDPIRAQVGERLEAHYSSIETSFRP